MAKLSKHEWEDVSQGVEGISNYGKRRCLLCGAVQTKECEQAWMRVVSYRWVPLAGRCKGGIAMTKVRMDGRKAAAAILRQLARHKEGNFEFCCSFCYDDDSEFLEKVAKELGMIDVDCEAFTSRLQRVCRRLEQCGILGGTLRSCHAEYLSEPRVLKRYEFADHAYAMRLAPDLWPRYRPMGSVETELEFLLDRAYPPSN